MSKVTKTVLLVAGALLLLTVGYNMFNGHSGPPSATPTDQKALELYRQSLEKTEKANQAQMDRIHSNILKSEQITEMSMKNQERFQVLLDRWERQTNTMDKILAQQAKTK